MQWYGGINGNCQVPNIADFNDFVVRVWEGCSSTACIPSGGSHFPGHTKCHDDLYNNGSVTDTEDCTREIGRGSAYVVSGCCQFFSGVNGGCSGTPYLELGEGECDEQIQISNFTCVSTFKSSFSSEYLGGLPC